MIPLKTLINMAGLGALVLEDPIRVTPGPIC